MGDDKYYRVNPSNGNPIYVSGAGRITIGANCPVGSYRVISKVKESGGDPIGQGRKDFTVVAGPSVTVEFPSTPIYRGASTTAIVKLHNLKQSATYTFRADVQTDRHVDANYCEGSGFGQDVTITPNGDNPQTRTVTISDNCETGTFELDVVLTSSAGERVDKTENFTVSTDPNATPFMTLNLSSYSVQPGTAIGFETVFFDLQGDANTQVKYLATLTSGGADAPASCKEDGLFDTDLNISLHRNPIKWTDQISDTCPAGSYTLKVNNADPVGHRFCYRSRRISESATRTPIRITIRTATRSATQPRHRQQRRTTTRSATRSATQPRHRQQRRTAATKAATRPRHRQQRLQMATTRTTAARTTAARTTAARTTAARTTAARTMAARTMAARTTAARTTAARTMAARTTVARTTVARTTAARTMATTRVATKATIRAATTRAAAITRGASASNHSSATQRRCRHIRPNNPKRPSPSPSQK